MTKKLRITSLLLFLLFAEIVNAQNTQIRGFASTYMNTVNGKTNVGFDEQDLFITSQVTNHFSFLGETVFKFTGAMPTDFSVSIERLLMKYNYAGNHSIIIGKHHTPLNYWNDTYHHGRVFFPTISRPLMFDANLIPLHTTGINFQGQNLGSLKFGYDLLIGNGLGASDVLDNDNNKSIAASINFSPIENLRFGISYYTDKIAKGADVHGFSYPINYDVTQNIYSGSLAYFGKNFEFLAESSSVVNHTDTTGSKRTIGAYVYGGVRITPKIVPYLKYENINYEAGEVYFKNNNLNSILGGVRYEVSYLSVVKLEFQHTTTDIGPVTDKLTIQFALGF